MKNNPLLSRSSGTYTSPGTPDYLDNNGFEGFQKGWSSERVPLPTNSSRRHISAAALIPFNSGRTLPSKWDDAERWITSPVSGVGVSMNSLAPAQRRPKSKSGPLGPPGTVFYSNYSPAMPLQQGGSVRNFMAGSPFTTGVLVPDGLSIQCSGGNYGKSNSTQTENNMTRLASLPGWLDLLSESSFPSSQDDKLEGNRDSEAKVSPAVSRRDMATQMSPDGSTCSSPEERLSFSTSPSNLPTKEPHSGRSSKSDVRDVQVDKRATVMRPSKKRGSPDVNAFDSSWDIAEAAKDTSKLGREEAKITAWENLQKAKAEAAIRKLEVKLEKKKSESMDKILNRLKTAQMKAQEMRSSMSDSHDHQVSRTSHKVVSLRKFIKLGIFRGCFT